MKVDILVAEIGSTITKISIFDGIRDGQPRFLGQTSAPTTVLRGDVTIGLQAAINAMKKQLQTDTLEAEESYACSSAAGGLRMSVHGLVYDMTVKAAKEAALGAGANLHLVTAGFLSAADLDRIRQTSPNIILVSGGVDYGEAQTAMENAKQIARMRLNVPVIFAGNIVNREEVQKAFVVAGQEKFLYVCTNVYPKIDQLEVEPARKIIQDVFEEHIVKAPGMERVRTLIDKTILPTPAAVLRSAILLQKAIGDVLVLDVGGATTDVHSVTEGNPELQKRMTNPEPLAKRTVEGDLGVYVNRDRLLGMAGPEKIAADLQMTPEELKGILEEYAPIPTARQIPLTEYLTSLACMAALNRHAGRFVTTFGPAGKTVYPDGRDLTHVEYVIGTGGALTRLPGGKKILSNQLVWQDPRILLPKSSAKVLLDGKYLMASVGAFSERHPEAALRLLRDSLGL